MPSQKALSLDALKKKFTEWRNKASLPRRIPAELWLGAIEMSRVYSVSKVSHALKIDYFTLKQRVASLEKDEIASLSNSSLPTSEKIVELKLASPDFFQKGFPIAEILSPSGAILRLFSPQSDSIIRAFMTS